MRWREPMMRATLGARLQTSVPDCLTDCAEAGVAASASRIATAENPVRVIIMLLPILCTVIPPRASHVDAPFRRHYRTSQQRRELLSRGAHWRETTSWPPRRGH